MDLQFAVSADVVKQVRRFFDSLPMTSDHRPLVFLSGLMLAPCAWAQDMVGPDWLKLLLAFPKLLLYAIGEFALFLVPLFALLAFGSWLLSRRSEKSPDRMSRTPVLVVLTLITAVPALLYWTMAPQTADPARTYRSTTTPEVKMPALQSPVGKAWPKDTGYLDMPQGGQGGRGSIVVSGKGSYQRHYVKLCVAKQAACPGLRHAFLQKFSQFEFSDLPPGEYELRYMPIDRPRTGGRSQPITLAGYAGESFVVTITDSPVLDSKYPVVGIRIEDF
jgi:hypothetical protein